MRSLARMLSSLQVVAGCAALALVTLMLLWADRGLDLTDEGFYLNWISRPGLWSASSTQFGFVYHPLWELTGGSIARLRQASILLTFALAWGCFLAVTGTSRRDAPRLVAVGAAAATAAVSLRIYDQWLLTPSYNTLTLQAALATTIGLSLWVRAAGGRSAYVGAVVVGLGGATLFLAKPPAAGAVAVVVTGTLVALGQLRWRVWVIGIASSVATLALAAVAIDGAPWRFFERVRSGARDAQTLDRGYSARNLLQVDALAYSVLSVGVGVGVLVGLALLTWCLTRRPGPTGRRLTCLVGAAILLLTALVVITRPSLIGASVAAVYPLVGVPLAALAVLGRWSRRHPAAGQPPGRRPSIRPDLTLTAALVCLPMCCAIGTNGDLWLAAGKYSVFWVLAAVAILLPVIRADGWQVLTPTVLVAVALSAVPLVLAMQHPYRQPGRVWDYTEPVRLGGGDELRVSTPTAGAIQDLREIARSAGMSAGDPVVDLTGQAPGLVFALDGEAVNSPWVPGALSGSTDLLRRSVDSLSCQEVAESWLLDQPGGPRSVAEGFFSTVGADVADYVVLGSVALPPTSSGPAEAQPRVRLLRDRRDSSVAVLACESARAGP